MLLNKDKNLNINSNWISSPTPGEDTLCGDMTPPVDNNFINEIDKDFDYNRQSEEEEKFLKYY